MSYKLLHKLFGWDYIYWESKGHKGICRIHILPDGTEGYWQYGNWWYPLTTREYKITHLTRK